MSTGDRWTFHQYPQVLKCQTIILNHFEDEFANGRFPDPVASKQRNDTVCTCNLFEFSLSGHIEKCVERQAGAEETRKDAEDYMWHRHRESISRHAVPQSSSCAAYPYSSRSTRPSSPRRNAPLSPFTCSRVDSSVHTVTLRYGPTSSSRSRWHPFARSICFSSH